MQSRPTVLPIITALLIVAALYLPISAYGMVATGPDGSNAQAVHDLGITGAGVGVGVLSLGNVRRTHEAFKDINGVSRADANNATTDGAGIIQSDHDTEVAGVVASRGDATHPNDIGVAPDANIYSERVVDTGGHIYPAYLETALDRLLSHNCYIVVSPFQMPASVSPNGSSQWSLLYDYYAYQYNMIFTNAAGNYIYNTATPPVLLTNRVTVFGDAYNGITTGGLAVVEPNVWRRVGSVSNLGLTADGRRKPDIVAPSQNQTMPNAISDANWTDFTSAGGQTSFSAPQTAGVAALLLQYASGVPNANQNEVIRAVIVNSTFPNIKDNNGVSTVGQLYNVARGYGRIDALRAYQTLSAGKITAGTSTNQTKGWTYSTISVPKNTTITQSYTIAGMKNQRLITTITWNRVINRSGLLGSYTYSAPSIYNLYLAVLDPIGNTIFYESDTKDNLKKCDILLPSTGNYQVQVKLTNTSTHGSSNWVQDYGLAFELVSAIPGDFDMNYIVDTNDLLTFANQWLLDGTNTADLVQTNHVDFADFAIFAQNWLTANNAYYAGY